MVARLNKPRTHVIFNALEQRETISLSKLRQLASQEGLWTRLITFIEKIFRYHDNSKTELIQSLLNAVIKFDEQIHDKQIIINFKDPLQTLTDDIIKINMEPGKFELTLNTNKYGKLSLFLNAVYPNGTESLLLHEFNQDCVWLENNVTDPPVEFQHFRELLKVIKTHNQQVQVGDHSKNYVECALNAFSDLKDQHKLLADKNPMYIDFMGSGDNKLKFDTEEPNAYRHVFLQHEKQKPEQTIVLDGPTRTFGNHFDNHICKGVVQAMNAVMNGHEAIILTGHSRGACEAIAVNNILVVALQGNDVLASQYIPKSIKGKKRKALENKIKKFANECLSSRRSIHLQVNLLDPVRGPFYQTGFDATNTFVVQDKHYINLVRCVNPHFVFFDIHLPKFEYANPNSMTEKPLTIFFANTSHGNLIRAPLLKANENNGSYEGYALICHLLGIKNTFNTAEHLEKQDAVHQNGDKGGNSRYRLRHSIFNTDLIHAIKI